MTILARYIMEDSLDTNCAPQVRERILQYQADTSHNATTIAEVRSLLTSAN